MIRRLAAVRAACAIVAIFPAMAPLAAQQPAATLTVTLREAIELAARNHPVTVAAEGAVEMAEAERLQRVGAFLPGLSLSSSYGNSSNQRFDQATGRLVSTSYTAQTQATYDIFTAGRRFVAYKSARAAVDAADASLREARYQTALETTIVFYDAAAAAELLTVANRRLERARQQLEFARTRLEVGTATRSDVLRAELEQGNAEVAVIDAESALRSARLGLGRQIGVGGEVQPAGPALPEAPPALPAPDSLAVLAQHTSPLVATAQALYAEAKAERLSAYTFYLPSLRVVGGYDWFSPTYPPTNKSWSLRLTASLPLFNGFQREASLARTAAAERTAEARTRDAALNARASAIDAAQQVESAGRRVAIARRAVELAQEDLRVQEERYQIGVATILELQTSQVALAEAEAGYVTARQQLGVSLATLEAVLGDSITTD
ncbi:MAG: TolC family protein [Longimicrobiales bacterium]